MSKKMQIAGYKSQITRKNNAIRVKKERILRLESQIRLLHTGKRNKKHINNILEVS